METFISTTAGHTSPARLPDCDVVLQSSIAVLLRPDRCVQFGVHPQEALVLPLPQHVDPAQALQVILQTRSGIPAWDLVHTLTYCGFDSPMAESIVEELLRAQILSPSSPNRLCRSYV